jgi:hypothetical protein
MKIHAQSFYPCIKKNMHSMLYLVIFLENQQNNIVSQAPGLGAATGTNGQHRSGAAPGSATVGRWAAAARAG